MPIALAAGLLGSLAMAAPAGATFPGANGRIAIEGPPCCAHGDSQGFYTIGPNGHGLRLTPLGLTRVRDVAWSPDGTRIAFTADSGDPPPAEHEESPSELYTAAADGSDVRRLTRNRLNERMVSWSPNARSLAFITTTAGIGSAEQLAVIPARGGKARILRRVDTITAEWSPDVETIAIGEPFAGIQLIPVDGGDAATIAPGTHARHFSWAPSGRTLVFAKCAEYCDLFKVNGDGTGLEPLLQRTSSTDYIGRPLWSPDGETIAFCRGLGNVAGLWAMGADGGDPHLVRPDSPACGHWLSWRPVVPPAPPCRAPVAGTPGPDQMTGGADYDTLAGVGGDDQLFGRGGPDCLLGGRGADVVRGGRGGDRLVGGRGNDRLAGGLGPDRIVAGSGRDRVRGGSGADSVDTSGGEADVVDCGPGDDSAVVSASDSVAGCEHVTVAAAASR